MQQTEPKPEADLPDVYYTPPEIIEFVIGSGAFLELAFERWRAIIENPPYQGDISRKGRGSHL